MGLQAIGICPALLSQAKRYSLGKRFLTLNPQAVAFSLFEQLEDGKTPMASNHYLTKSLNSSWMLLRMVLPFLSHFSEAGLIYYPWISTYLKWIGRGTSIFTEIEMEQTLNLQQFAKFANINAFLSLSLSINIPTWKFAGVREAVISGNGSHAKKRKNNNSGSNSAQNISQILFHFALNNNIRFEHGNHIDQKPNVLNSNSNQARYDWTAKLAEDHSHFASSNATSMKKLPENRSKHFNLINKIIIMSISNLSQQITAKRHAEVRKLSMWSIRLRRQPRS